jgi:hypothetical protein
MEGIDGTKNESSQSLKSQKVVLQDGANGDMLLSPTAEISHRMHTLAEQLASER